MAKSNSLKVKTTTKDPENPVAISDELKTNWNKYLDWLDKKGMKGKPELDKGGVGNKLFKQYLSETADAKLSEKDIPVIRQAYKEMRDQGIKDQKEGKIAFGTGVTAENFMSHIVANEKTSNPNYVGQHLTQTRFPGMKAQLKNFKGDVIKEVSAAQRPSSVEEVNKLSFKNMKQ